MKPIPRAICGGAGSKPHVVEKLKRPATTTRAIALQPHGWPILDRLGARRASGHRNRPSVHGSSTELQYLHAGTLFARPRPPCARGWRWSAVKTSRFLTSVSASSR